MIPFFRPDADFPEPTEWDIVRIDDTPLPGLCTCEVEPSRDIENTKEKGKDGRSLTDNGYAGSPVNIGIMIWRNDQLKALFDIMPKMHPRKPGGVSAPLNLYHPAAALMGINVIAVQKIRIPTPEDDGILRVQVSAIEWFPETQIKSTNAKKAPADGGPLDSSDFEVPPPDPANLGSKFP
jgi:hypothetical protein